MLHFYELISLDTFFHDKIEEKTFSKWKITESRKIVTENIIYLGKLKRNLGRIKTEFGKMSKQIS